MRKTRAAYHIAVRHVKRNEQDVINDRFAPALLNDISRNFWSELNVSDVTERDSVTLLIQRLILLIL